MTDTRNTYSAPPGRSLRRSNEEKILAGVAGGLGQHLGINAWWFRWAFILLAFIGGSGVLLYILAWIFIPEPDEDDTAVSHWLSTLDMSDGGTILGVALIGAASVIVAASILDISGGLIAAGILFAIGFMLYRGGLTAPTKRGGPPASGGHDDDLGDADLGPGSEAKEPDMAGPSTEEVDGSAGYTEDGVAASAVAATAVEAPPFRTARQKRPPQEKSMLGQMTLAIGIIVVSLMALLDVSGVSIGSVDSGEFFDPIHYAATALGIIAIGLIVGTWVGRARWLIVIGILILPIVFVTSLWPRTFPWTAGDPIYQPTIAAEVDSPYELGVGQLTVDLSLLSAEELAQIGRIEATLGAGELIIRIPPDVGVMLDGQVGLGVIEVPGTDSGGIGVSVFREFGESPTLLVIDAEVGAGVITLTGPAGIHWKSADIAPIQGDS